MVADWRKGVLPKLIKVLKSAGDGSACVIYPNMLPFISQMPADDTVRSLAFIEVFFGAMING